MKETLNKTRTPKKVKYSIVLTLGTEILKGTGDSLLEALTSITPPVKITTKCLVKATDGKKKLEKMLMPIQARRLFYPQAQFYQARMLTHLLK
jgi:hypothetical protein